MNSQLRKVCVCVCVYIYIYIYIYILKIMSADSGRSCPSRRLFIGSLKFFRSHSFINHVIQSFLIQDDVNIAAN